MWIVLRMPHKIEAITLLAGKASLASLGTNMANIIRSVDVEHKIKDETE